MGRIGKAGLVRVLPIAVSLGGCGPAAPAGASRARLVVAAAVSLRELCEATRTAYLAAHPDVDLAFAFDASSTLSRQIEAGTAFGAFLAADAETVERVRARLVATSITPFLGNRLVVAVRGEAGDVPADLAALVAGRGKVALAGPAVPAGRYARRYLEGQHLEGQHLEGQHREGESALAQLSPRIVNADNVRAALALVESGAAEFAFVYATDLAVGRRARLAFAVPAVDDPGIRYVAAAVQGAGAATALGGDYVQWLRGDAFRAHAAAMGFVVPP